MGDPGIGGPPAAPESGVFSTKALRVTLTAVAASTQQRDWLLSRLAKGSQACSLDRSINKQASTTSLRPCQTLAPQHLRAANLH